MVVGFEGNSRMSLITVTQIQTGLPGLEAEAEK